MPIEIPVVERLTLFESRALIPIQTFTPEVYTKRMLSEGNSLLSSLFIVAMDPGASVKASYWDTGVGSDAGERYELGGHPLLTSPTAPSDDRQLITKLHNKPNLELIVTGGNVTLGVYITVVQSFASDLDSALKRDEQIVDLNRDKGIPIVTYDDAAGQFFFLKSINGNLPIAIAESGTPKHRRMAAITTPGLVQELFNESILVEEKLKKLVIVCRSHAKWTMFSDGTMIASGRCGPAESNVNFVFDVSLTLTIGSIIKLEFIANSSSPIVDVEAYMMSLT
jgi:hypothetical protein